MYFLSQLSRPSLQFVNELTSSAANRTKAFAIAIGYVLARKIALPTGQVDDLASFYRMQHSTAVLEVLSTMNDVAPFDTRAARKFVEDFYGFRYRTANPPLIPLAVRKDFGLVDFFGLNMGFSEDDLKEISSNPEKISYYISGLTSLFADRDEKIRAANIGVSVPREVSYVA